MTTSHPSHPSHPLDTAGIRCWSGGNQARADLTLALISVVCLWFCVAGVLGARAAGPSPNVGMEGQVEIALPGTPLEARPVDMRSKVLLRVAGTRPHGDLIAYDLRYVGLEPGEYDLRDYLVRADGSPTNDLPSIPVRVGGLLPNKHDGYLIPQPAAPIPYLGGYLSLLMLLAAGWVLALVPLLLLGRKWKKKAPLQSAMPEPTLADRLRPLVERAAAGTLPPDGQAQLERLLLSYWRERLDLRETDLVQSVIRLRAHPEAGALLRQLESWLHRPPGSSMVDVRAMLEPYRERKLGGQRAPENLK